MSFSKSVVKSVMLPYVGDIFIIKASLTEHPYKRTVVVMGKDEDLHNLFKFHSIHILGDTG